jgi:prevent-host-death family protein
MNTTWKVREIAAGEFKAKCLQLMDEVQQEGIELVITKRGKPVAKLVPADSPPSTGLGCMRGTARVTVDYDIWESDPTEWPVDDESW